MIKIRNSEMVTWTMYIMVGYGLLKQGESGIDYQQTFSGDISKATVCKITRKRFKFTLVNIGTVVQES